MSERSKVEIPPELAELLNGEDLAAKSGTAVLLVTGDGIPRVAALSAGEVLVRGARIGLLLYTGSRTCAAVRASGRGLLLGVADGALVRLHLVITERPDAPAGRALLVGEVDTVEIDKVGYATVTAGISFELADPQRAVERWRDQIATLRVALA